MYDITETILAYYDDCKGNETRYKSWEHCYKYFQLFLENKENKDNPEYMDLAALHLGFYLASWGMYRGSSFLIRYDYKIHLEVVQLLADKRYDQLRKYSFGINENDNDLIVILHELISNIKEIYKEEQKKVASTKKLHEPTDTLVTKIILGTLGSLPACDRFFVDGVKEYNKSNKSQSEKFFSYSTINQSFLENLLKFSHENKDQLEKARQKMNERQAQESKIQYPIMKLVDMYFWKIGEKCQGGNNEKSA